jgi:hypothetical protein
MLSASPGRPDYRILIAGSIPEVTATLEDGFRDQVAE